jgi:SulP family sulfate permease
LAATLALVTNQVIASEGQGSARLLPTVLMFVFLSSVGCGVILQGIGMRRWGRYVRYIPYPVVGGFMAGTGYLLLIGSYSMLTGVRFAPDAVERLVMVDPLALGTVFSVAGSLLYFTRRSRHYWVIPMVLLTSVGLFHVVRVATGIDVEAARASGLLPAPLSLGDWKNVVNFDYGVVRWDILLYHIRDFIAMSVVVAIGILINTTGLEVASDCEADADRELRALGLANVLSGLAGGMVGLNTFNRSMLNLHAGAMSPWAARFAALFMALLMLAAPGCIGYLPKPVLTGLIAYLGLGLLATWTIEARKRMLGVEYLVSLLILVGIAALGVVQGVTLGIVIACLSYIVTLGRSATVKYSFNGETRRSNVERPAAHLAWLQAHGDVLHGFVLQGVLFFGTASQVLEHVRINLGRTRYALLDFRLVHGADGSATLVLGKLQRLCRGAGIELIFTGISPQIETVLRRSSFDLNRPGMHFFPDLDHGLEWCEDNLIAGLSASEVSAPRTDGFLEPEERRELAGFFESEVLTAGTRLAAQGDASDSMFLVESGRLSVYLRIDECGTSKRLRSYGAGTILGEMGLYTCAPRSADVVADIESRVLRFTVSRVEELERTHPALALKLHRHVVCTLAERVRSSNEEVRLML